MNESDDLSYCRCGAVLGVPESRHPAECLRDSRRRDSWGEYPRDDYLLGASTQIDDLGNVIGHSPW